MDRQMKFVGSVAGGLLLSLTLLAFASLLTLPRYAIVASLVYLGITLVNPTNLVAAGRDNTVKIAYVATVVVVVLGGYEVWNVIS